MEPYPNIKNTDLIQDFHKEKQEKFTEAYKTGPKYVKSKP